LSAPLSICLFLTTEPLLQTVLQSLDGDRYTVTRTESIKDFSSLIERQQHPDCLILQSGSDLPSLANWLHGQAILLPAIIIRAEQEPPKSLEPPLHHENNSSFIYHTAEVYIDPTQVSQLDSYIEQAIEQFIHLSPTYRLNKSSSINPTTDLTVENALRLQQHRLTDKLKERLGYLGVYYKRDPKNFFRYLPPEEKQELLDQLKAEYRDIVLLYFASDGTLNQRIDAFVNTVFFADIPVSQVVEIHMELMDEFAKQLKLEGRSEEILLDYRLTLIDTIAHLCEMYRRSIPKES
jgi:circadian clock protein KaiA